MKKMIYLAGVVLALGFTACGSDDDGGAVDCLAQTNAVSDAASAYLTDQSTANCNAYKTALQNYLNAGCAVDEASKASFEASLKNLSCN
ncbi:MAG TPA: hypothetical protein PKL31_11795 [Fulvivirga sp.]|nr:hypothetical protein [Fulvivirga sp.]